MKVTNLYIRGLFKFSHSLNSKAVGHYMGLVMGLLTINSWMWMCFVTREVSMWEAGVIAKFSDLLFSLASDSAKQEFSFQCLSQLPSASPNYILIWFFSLLLHFCPCCLSDSAPASPFFLFPASTLTTPSTCRGMTFENTCSGVFCCLQLPLDMRTLDSDLSLLTC